MSNLDLFGLPAQPKPEQDGSNLVKTSEKKNAEPVDEHVEAENEQKSVKRSRSKKKQSQFDEEQTGLDSEPGTSDTVKELESQKSKPSEQGEEKKENDNDELAPETGFLSEENHSVEINSTKEEDIQEFSAVHPTIIEEIEHVISVDSTSEIENQIVSDAEKESVFVDENQVFHDNQLTVLVEQFEKVTTIGPENTSDEANPNEQADEENKPHTSDEIQEEQATTDELASHLLESLKEDLAEMQTSTNQNPHSVSKTSSSQKEITKPEKPSILEHETIPDDDEIPVLTEDSEAKPKSEPIPVYISKEIRKRRGEPVDESDNQMPLADFDPLAVYKGMVRRFFIINRHTIGLFAGGLIAFRKALPKSRTRGLRFIFTRMAAAMVRPFVMKDLRDKPFPVQLRRRLELMGPTYIKLGQILALREDILPDVVTEELKNLLDRLPPIDFNEIMEIVQKDLNRPVAECFKEINKKPIGTASIAQTHLALTVNDERVVLKVVKPGIRDSILTDIRLLKLISGFLQWAIPQYQPKQLIDEFCAYTEKEVDLTNEADHAEIFAANFNNHPLVKFPKIYREYSGQDVLCMEFMDGFKPGAPQTDELSQEEREQLVETGAASIIQMLYKDGFFHADLHPGNLMILPGPKLGFIDLGMVGRFEDKTRRRMLYYFHALVSGDIDGATKYLLAMARVGQGGDPQGFRRAVADTLRRYYMHAQSGDFSLGQLILNSLSIGGKYRVFFPVEMTLMVKALVTFEGVGFLLLDKLDVPKLSEKYVSKIFKDQFNPKAIVKELMRGAPELVDMLVQLPKLSADGLKFLEENLNDRSPSNPLEGIKSAIIAGACLVGGVLALIQGAHWGVYSILFGLALLFSLFGK